MAQELAVKPMARKTTSKPETAQGGARKAAQEGVRKKPGPAPTGRKTVAVAVKASPEWKAWFDALAAHCRLKGADLVDHALTEFAKQRGFDRDVPER